MADQKKQRAAYDFLSEHARNGATFTMADLSTKMGWKGQTATTYRSKHLDMYLVKVSRGVYRVIPEFRRVTWSQFQETVTQVRRPFASYNRATYEAVVVYDFLMPLTREDKLRKSLDNLFYRDTLKQRIEEVGLTTLAVAIPRDLGDNDDEYVARVINFVDEHVGGFSISHVSGRFRIGPIVARRAAADLVAAGQEYLMDETTAVVRFIIPCLSSKSTHGGDFDLTDPTEDRKAEIDAEIRQIRTIFFELFVEALVPTIRGEKLIWMLESTPNGQRVYELDRVEVQRRAGTKTAGEAEPTHDEDDNDDAEGDEAAAGQ